MKRGPVLRWVRRVWIAAGLAFMAWLVWNVQAHGVPASTFASSDRIAVSSDGPATVFEPRDAAPDAPVLIFLPGGLVAPRAYGPLVRAVAETGMPAAIVPLPYRSAPGDSGREELWSRIRAAASRWPTRRILLGGHSRGGALAARFAAAHPGEVAGLVLMGTTHPRDEDLSTQPLRVLKILGSRDCVAPVDDARANAAKLPPDTEWVVIDGANHGQFGHYGTQLGDCDATITREAQQAAVVEAIQAWNGPRGS